MSPENPLAVRECKWPTQDLHWAIGRPFFILIVFFLILIFCNFDLIEYTPSKNLFMVAIWAAENVGTSAIMH